MTLLLILNAIAHWATPPPPIQGFDRWEPAALFRMSNIFPKVEIDERPNHDKLGVKNVGGWESRSHLEFDLESLPGEFERITLRILISNSDPDSPVEVVEFFHYTGDGEEDVEDWDAGELFRTHDYPHPRGAGKYRINLDVGEMVRTYRDEGRRYLGFRLSAPAFARFGIGKSRAIHDPNPFFAVHHDGARTDSSDFTDSSDIWPFATCMVGPDQLYTSGCALQWDYSDDDFVDLADFAIFQAMFGEQA